MGHTALSMKELNQTVSYVGGLLDGIERQLQEWGHAGASDFILIPDVPGVPTRDKVNESPFYADNRSEYSTYANALREKVQGAAVVSGTTATSIGATVGIGNNELAEAADRLKQRKTELDLKNLEREAAQTQTVDELKFQLEQAKALKDLEKFKEDGTEPALPTAPATGATATPALVGDGTAPTTTLPTPAADPAAPSFTDAGKLIKDLPASHISLSESDILKIATSNKVMENILRQMSDPQRWTENRRVFMGMTQVSVSPGWRTREGYVCEVQVHPRYAKSKKLAESECQEKSENLNSSRTSDLSELPGMMGTHGNQPSIFAAFPLAEAQSLDMAYSGRQQFDLMAKVAAQYVAAGQTAKADLVLKYMRKLEQDVQTRSLLPVVVPSSDGTQITYRFDPSLQALGQPESIKTKPAMLMHPTSIPALVILICEEAELKDYDSITLQTSTRWVPSQFRHPAKRYLFDPIFKGRTTNIIWDNDTRLKCVADLGMVQHHLNVLNTYCYTHPQRLLTMELSTRFSSLQTVMMGSRTQTSLPLPTPSVYYVTPESIPEEADGTQTLKIYGTGFKGWGTKKTDTIVKSVTLNNIPLNIKSITDDQGNLGIDDMRCIEAYLPGRAGKWGWNRGAEPPTLQVVTKGGVAYATMGLGVKKPDPKANSVKKISRQSYKLGTPGEAPLKFTVILEKPSKEVPTILIGNKDASVIGSTPAPPEGSRIFTASLPNPAGFAVGKYDAAVYTQSMEHVEQEVLTVVKADEKPKLDVTAVEPKEGYLYDQTVMLLKGTAFLKEDGSVRVTEVKVGKEVVDFYVLNDKEMVILVKRWLPRPPAAPAAAAAPATQAQQAPEKPEKPAKVEPVEAILSIKGGKDEVAPSKEIKLKFVPTDSPPPGVKIQDLTAAFFGKDEGKIIEILKLQKMHDVSKSAP